MSERMGEKEHRCREHLRKPRRWRLGQVRSCPCGLLYACHRWGILAPTPMWLRVDLRLPPGQPDHPTPAAPEPQAVVADEATGGEG